MEIIRGDTAQFKFQRKDANGDVIMTKANKLYFTVKKTKYHDDLVIQKTIDDMTFDKEGYYHFTIESDDTDNLDYGEYYYDIEVVENNYTATLKRDILTISYEITYKGNEV